MKKSNPVLFVILGIVVMLLAGFVYAWSILSAPIAADFINSSTSQLSLAFTLCMSFFCLGGMCNGFLVQKIDTKWTFSLSALLFLLGFLVTSRAETLPMLYVGYGVICGAASGFSYNSVMATVPRWFPHKQATISGALLMGFGLSTLVIGRVFSAITSDEAGAWRHSLMTMGIVMAVVILICAFLIRKPNPEEEKLLPKPAAAAADSSGSSVELTPAKMLASASFWLFFIWEVLLSAGGLNIIGQARSLAQESSAADLSLGTLALFVGAISVFNGLGRVFFGSIFDKKGRKITMTFVSIVAIASSLIIFSAVKFKLLPLLIVGFMFMGLSYGGGPVMSAAFTKSTFGTKYFSINFSIMSLCLLVASFGSQFITSIYDRFGQNFNIVLLIILGCMICTLIIGFILPERKDKRG